MDPIMQSIERNEQVFEQCEERTKDLLELNRPNITVITHPDASKNPLISTVGIEEFDHSKSKYWKLHECGLAYHRRILARKPEHNYKYLSSNQLIRYIIESIARSASFYKKRGDIGNILITATLDQILSEQLAGLEDINKYLAIENVEQQKCMTLRVSAEAGCLSEDLVDREHLMNTVDNLVAGLFPAFNINYSSEDRRTLIKYVLEHSL